MNASPPRIDENFCSGCLACVESCPNQALTACWERGFLEVCLNPGHCIFCGRCAGVCPEKALDYAQDSLAPDSTVREIRLVRLSAICCSACRSPFVTFAGQRKISREPSRPGSKFLSQRHELCPRCRSEAAAKHRRQAMMGEVRR